MYLLVPIMMHSLLPKTLHHYCHFCCTRNCQKLCILSYRLQPFKNIDLITTVEIAIRNNLQHNISKPTIALKTEGYMIDLSIEEINYVMSEKNYLLVYSDKGVYRIRSTIRLILEKLPSSTFVQVHRAYIVNKNKIEKYKPKSVVIKDHEIPISKKYSLIE